MTQRYEMTAVVLLGLALSACSRNFPTATNGSAPAASDRVAEASSATRSQARVFTAAGDITPSVNAFRDALGTLNANLPGSRDGGRREINWDAVPAANTDNDNFPADFFNQPPPGRARGAVFTTPGTGFRVSDNNFTDLNPEFANEFVFFSPIRTFVAVGSNRMTTTFFVPGSNDPANSTGFGVVFPPSIVARVEIKSGEAPVSAGATDVGNRRRGDDDGDDDERGDHATTRRDDDHDGARPRDLVIMDDFIYGEPIAPSRGVPVSVPTNAGAADPKAGGPGAH